MRELLSRDEESPSAASSKASSQSSAAKDSAEISGPVAVKIIDVIGERDSTPMIAYYAAGTAVLFLLFAASGAGGALLEEEETGVLGRLLSSRLSMTQLLLGKWLLIATVGVVQVFIMFAWGACIFGVPLFTPYHLSGFAIMTVATAAAAASFGLVIAAACRSRAQLGGLSTIVILVMSAVGGSMVPRFIMPEGMKTAGYFTFNAWALDGYQKVFWRKLPLVELWPQVLVLTGVTVVCLVAARLLARRWETAS
jgi:ABC-2 type transport system permease protein